MQAKLTASGKRLFLGHFIEEAVIGQPFPRSNWPLHITLVPWFICGGPNRLDQKLAEAAVHLAAFDARVGGEMMFGPKRNIRVNLIEPNIRLARLHEQLLGAVQKLGRLDTDEQFTGKGYRAHITHVGGRRKLPGDIIRIDSIHLTELTNDSQCTPLRHYRIGR